jgi:hypothetical protein
VELLLLLFKALLFFSLLALFLPTLFLWRRR